MRQVQGAMWKCKNMFSGLEELIKQNKTQYNFHMFNQLEQFLFEKIQNVPPAVLATLHHCRLGRRVVRHQERFAGVALRWM